MLQAYLKFIDIFGELNYSFFNSGAETNEGALKLHINIMGQQEYSHSQRILFTKLIATSQITDSPEVSFDFGA